MANAPQGAGVDQMPRTRCKGGGAHDEIARLEQLVQTRDLQAQPGPSPRVGRFGVDAENPGAAESEEAFRHRDSHAARTQDPHRAPVEPSPVESGTPALERTASHEAIARSDVARQRDQQTYRKLGGRDRQQVGNHRDPHAPPGAGLDVEVVVALERTGHDAEVGTALQHLVVHPIRHEREQGMGAACAGDQLVVRPRLRRPVADYFAARTKPLQHLAVDTAGDGDPRSRHALHSLDDAGRDDSVS